MSLNFNSIPTKTLSESITSAATSFKLNNITGWDGVDLVAGDFGTVGYGVFVNANKTQIELFEFDPTTIASASITINKRGLKFTGDLTTEVAGNKFSWTKGDTYVNLGTDSPQVFQYLKEYIDGVAIAGSPDAALATKGITKLSVAPASAGNPIAVGDNDGRVPTQAENDAMAGGGDFGTPSTSNKFLTETYFSGRTIRTQYDLAGSPHTWTKQSGLKYIIVEIWGGGGNGSSNATAARCGGGGGGGYTKKRLEASELGATETVTIGGSATNSTFGSLVTGYKGGNGGNYVGGSNVSGGGGGGVTGAGGNGADTGLGNPGSPGASIAGTGYYSAAYVFPNNFIHGNDGGGAGASGSTHEGGNSLNGGGGGGNHNLGAGSSAYGGNGGAGNSGGVGSNGAVPGGGGGGGSTGGGTGGAGRCIVTEFYA